jgi:hypothetical protein
VRSLLDSLPIGVGDPTVAGWVIFFSYFGAALLCARALAISLAGARMSRVYTGRERRSRDRSPAYRASFWFWAIMIGLLMCLGVNKQIDLQTWITHVGRRIAMAQGWYKQRGEVQSVAVLAIAVLGLAAMAVLLKLTRELLPRHVLAFFGVVLLAVFVAMRACSYHDIDDALRVELAGIRVGWILELGGIYCISLSAIVNTRWYRVEAWQILRRWRRLAERHDGGRRRRRMPEPAGASKAWPR